MSNERLVYETIERMIDGADIKIIVGDCPTGADAFARIWCFTNNVEYDVYYADWERHGRAAGPLRNMEMIAQKPDLVLAFYAKGASNKGTSNCVKQAVMAGIPVMQYYEGDNS